MAITKPRVLRMAGPQEHIFDLPQERITGDILRGYGPRRGGLERLLRYWRPIMRKPGGFRRCLVILADHPELYPLPNICAWLHHETTGKWPNEGCHHPGMRNCGAAAGRAARAIIPGKGLPRRGYSAIYQPLNGDQNLLEFKAGWGRRFGHGLLSSFLIPGERPALLHHNPIRSILWNIAIPGGGGLVPGVGTPSPIGLPGGPGQALSPGGGTVLGNIAGSIGGAPQGGWRCPGGFEFGGRFTNRAGSTCGQQLFAAAGTSLRTRGTEQGPFYEVMPGRFGETTRIGTEGTRPPTGPIQTIGTEGTRMPGPSTHRTLGTEGAEIPVRPIRPRPMGGAGGGGGNGARGGRDITRINLGKIDAPPVARVGAARADEQEKAVDAIARGMGRMRKSPGFPVNRLVRQDSTILTPLVPVEALAQQRNNADLRDGVFVSYVDDPERMGENEIPLLATGIRSLAFGLPGGGTVRLNRQKPITGHDVTRFRQALVAVDKDSDLDAGYGSRLQRLADVSGGKLSFGVTYPGLRNPTQRVFVEDAEGKKRRVPMWVFKAFLAADAPARPKGRSAYKLLTEEYDAAKEALAEPDLRVARLNAFLMKARGEALKKVTRTPIVS